MPRELVPLSIEKRLASYEKLIGNKYTSEMIAQRYGLPKGYSCFNTCASADNIRRFVAGIGDLNPRFMDSDYAKTTKYGRLVAQPLFPISQATPFTGYPAWTGGVRALHSGSEWEFFQPVLEDDKLDFRGIGLAAVELKKSKFSGQMIVTTSICEYRSQRGVVALAKGIVYYPSSNKMSRSMAKYKGIKVHRYTSDELHKLEEDREKEEMRGSQPRYWEDVVEGESIPHIVSGPWSPMDTVSWGVGHGGAIFGTGPRWYRMMEKAGRYQPLYNPITNTMAHCELVHIDNELARRIGAPSAFDAGVERESIVSILFSNWMGDDGFLWKYSIQLRRYVCYGDTNWYQAKVVRKYIDDGKCCVDLEYWGDNQDGERTTMGRATIILPSKTYGPAKYPSPRFLEDVYPIKD